jgi:hypothetical protein
MRLGKGCFGRVFWNICSVPHTKALIQFFTLTHFMFSDIETTIIFTRSMHVINVKN